jgi:hypothetical protein
MFMCQESSCPNKETQSLYCALCIKIKHSHTPVLISEEVYVVSQQWVAMKIKIIELYSEVEERYNKYKNVIIYLEDSMN